MSYLVRKISRGKWPNEEIDKDLLEGDTISDLRTTKNTLSLWKVDSEEELESAVLALSASSKSESIEAIDIVWIPESVLMEASMTISDAVPGDTVINDLSMTHRDLTCVTYKSLGDLAEIITHEIVSNRHHKKITLGKVRKALAKAYKEKRIAEEKCTPLMLEKIRQAYEQYKNEV